MSNEEKSRNPFFVLFLKFIFMCIQFYPSSLKTRNKPQVPQESLLFNSAEGEEASKGWEEPRLLAERGC